MEMQEKVYVEKEEKEYASKGVAGAALGLGIAGTALGLGLFNGCGLFGNRNACATGCAGGGAAPTAFEAWSKGCDDAVALTAAIYQGRITELQERFADRQVINQEMFGIYKSQIDADFGLYKNQRDSFDVLQKEISDLKAHVAVTDGIRPYQDRIIELSIADARKDAAFHLEREMCRVIKGEVVLPQTPTVTGYPSYGCWGPRPGAPAAQGSSKS